jgi:hypothetical protein
MFDTKNKGYITMEDFVAFANVPSDAHDSKVSN